MKMEYWLLLGVGAYLLYSKSGMASGAPFTYPAGGLPGGSRSTGSGGTTASGSGMGTSSSSPPIGANPGNPSFVGPVQTPGGGPGFVGPVQMSPGQSVTNADGTVTSMDITGVVTTYDPSTGITYDSSGSVIAAATDNTVYDSMDPCDPNSSMYDPTQCGTAVGGSGLDTGSPDWGYL